MFNGRSRTKNTIINAATGMGTQLLITVIQFIARTVFIQCLGRSYLGINSLFSNILTMLSLTELGLDTAMNFKLYKPLAEGDVHRLQVLMKFYRRAYLVVGFVMIGLGLVLVPFLPVLIKDYDSVIALGINPVLIFLLFLAQSSMSYLFFASKSAILKADQKMYITNRVHLYVTLAVTIIQIITLKIYSNFILYTFLSVLSVVILNLITAKIAVKQYPDVFENTDENINTDEVKGLFKDLGALFIFKANSVVVKATDNIVLSAFIGIDIVGQYSNYALFFSSINVFLNKIYGAIDASIGNLFATEKLEKRYSFFKVTNYLTIIIFGTAAVGLAICTDELIQTWIGQDYVIANRFATLIGIEMYLQGLKQNLMQIRNASGIFKQMWYRPLIGIIINIVVSVWLVNVYGINGVIIGTIASDICSNILFDPFIIYKHAFEGFKPVSEFYIKNSLYVMAIIMVYMVDKWLCSFICINQGWISVIVHIFICGMSVPLLLFLAFYRTDENIYMIQAARNILKRN